MQVQIKHLTITFVCACRIITLVTVLFHYYNLINIAIIFFSEFSVPLIDLRISFS